MSPNFRSDGLGNVSTTQNDSRHFAKIDGYLTGVQNTQQQ